MRNVTMRPTEFASLSNDKLRKRLEKREAKVLATKGASLVDDEAWIELQREMYMRSLPMPKSPSAWDDFERECDELDAEHVAICTAKLREDDPKPSLPSLDDVADLYERDGWLRALLDFISYDTDEHAFREHHCRVPYLPQYSVKNSPNLPSSISLKWQRQLDGVPNDNVKRHFFEDYLPYLPYLRRIGMKIFMQRGLQDPDIDEDTRDCTMMYLIRGKDRHLSALPGNKQTLFEGWLQGYGDDAGPWKSTLTFYPTDARSVRFRGLLKCIPRLLRMLHGVPGKHSGARDRVHDPVHLRERADAIVTRSAAEAMDTETNENPAHAAADARATEALEAQAWARKRQLIDAIHCDPNATREGAKWVCLKLKARPSRDDNGEDDDSADEEDARPKAMRIEAVADSHFIFQHNPVRFHNDWAIVVLHRDAFEVVEWDRFRNGFKRTCEDKFASRFKDLDEATDDDSDEEE